jgi:predicted Ser/Thr protein kinase
MNKKKRSSIERMNIRQEEKNIQNALEGLDFPLSESDCQPPLPFDDFLRILAEQPARVIRNVFQTFNDMVLTFVRRGEDEYPDDPESISFMPYDFTDLFVSGADNPFFADRLFANRLIHRVAALRAGAQQNKIYIFEGPHGCGKSTFLNNLLRKFEEYANTEEGMRYETVWRLDRKVLGLPPAAAILPPFARTIPPETDVREALNNGADEGNLADFVEDYIDIPCPSHDNPFLIIPREHRRNFFDDLFQNDQFKWRLFTEKEYEWVFTDKPCTICSSLYRALLARLRSPLRVFQLVYARPYHVNRRRGEGISVYNPGDMPLRKEILTNEMLQQRINAVLQDSNLVNYIFSEFARTNNGIFALMDIKSHNVERLIRLHNMISEGVHKVGHIEENVDSLFLAVMNPEDTSNIRDIPSFTDRVEYLQIPYVLDVNTEVEIYRTIFGRHIEESFLPRVLQNFARVIISSRMNTASEAMAEWIGNPAKYERYCDPNLLLLKMQIFTGHIPLWLSGDDRKKFTAAIRRKLIAEGEQEGHEGFSGRDSIKIFNEFYSRYYKDGNLISMSALADYFNRVRKDLSAGIPEGFIDCLIRMYDYNILQEVKESLFDFNEDQIARDIQNYIFAVNFEPQTTEHSNFTGERIEITEKYFEGMELKLLGPGADPERRKTFRRDTQSEYTRRALTQEVMVEGKPLFETRLYKDLHGRYVYNLKEKVLDPFLENENFRRAIKDYRTDDFKTYDKRIRADVTFLITNLAQKYRYTDQGALEVCIYVIDRDLARKFASKS